MDTKAYTTCNPWSEVSNPAVMDLITRYNEVFGPDPHRVFEVIEFPGGVVVYPFGGKDGSLDHEGSGIPSSGAIVLSHYHGRILPHMYATWAPSEPGSPLPGPKADTPDG